MYVENLHNRVVFLGEQFLRNILTISGNIMGCLVFLCKYAIAIIIYLTASTLRFILDSH